MPTLEILSTHTNYYAYFYPNHLKTRLFKIWSKQSGFQMLNTRWRPFQLGFRSSDPIQNFDHLQTNLFLTIQIPDMCDFQIPTISSKSFLHKLKCKLKIKLAEFLILVILTLGTCFKTTWPLQTSGNIINDVTIRGDGGLCFCETNCKLNDYHFYPFYACIISY